MPRNFVVGLCTLVIWVSRFIGGGGGGGERKSERDRKKEGEKLRWRWREREWDYIYHTNQHLFPFPFLITGTVNSSTETRELARSLADDIGSYHSNIDIDLVTSAILKTFTTLTGKTPQFKAHGGTVTENLALQNIQARTRMVMAYLLAQLLPWVRGRSGFLLVLGSANVDEALRGYMTKYDCSSADLNPIGGISKGDLTSFLKWAASNMNYDSLNAVVAAPPTAELEPTTADYKQKDEDDMGMTYEELGVFGRLRKVYLCGPVSMFEKLKHQWSHLDIETVGAKVKKFFFYYSINRHKLTTLTPSYHAESYSPDDNRYDLRQFLYNPKWTRQFGVIDKLVKAQQESHKRMQAKGKL